MSSPSTHVLALDLFHVSAAYPIVVHVAELKDLFKLKQFFDNTWAVKDCEGIWCRCHQILPLGHKAKKKSHPLDMDMASG
jgi:hypothetical protein